MNRRKSETDTVQALCGIDVAQFNYCSAVANVGILKTMVAMNQIEGFAQRIGCEFGAERVILFGSYARGVVTDDSDVDLLVIAPFEGRSVDQSVKIRMKLRPRFPVDLIVRTPQKLRQRIEMGDGFIREILQEGKVLYEADNR